jgi:hypothetical protein
LHLILPSRVQQNMHHVQMFVKDRSWLHTTDCVSCLKIRNQNRLLLCMCNGMCIVLKSTSDYTQQNVRRAQTLQWATIRYTRTARNRMCVVSDHWDGKYRTSRNTRMCAVPNYWTIMGVPDRVLSPQSNYKTEFVLIWFLSGNNWCRYHLPINQKTQ